MSANQQPSGPSQATRVLFHVLFSLLASAIMAGATAGLNYLYTGGNSINITVVLSAATAAFFVFLVTHAPSVLKSNQGQLLAGVHDILLDVHQPILTYLAQLMQQTNQIQQVAQATLIQVAPTAPVPQAPQPAPLPISQQQTANMPVVTSTPSPISQQPTYVNMPAMPSGGGSPSFNIRDFVVTQSGIPTVQP